jgi:predicted phage replisome organizer
MSVNKKYFYLKFKENYFDQDHIKAIESMKNGHTYSLILLKLYLKALKYDGQLKMNESIPYLKDRIELLAGVIGHDPDHVSKAINLGKSVGVVDILDTGEIFMSDIQNFIGHSSTEAERKAAYRRKLEDQRDKNGTLSQDVPPELDIEIELDKEIDNKAKKETKKNGDFVAIRDHYFKAYEEKTGQKPYFNGSHGKAIKNMLQKIDVEELKQLIGAWFSDDFGKKVGYDLVKMQSCINALRVKKQHTPAGEYVGMT